MKIIWHVDDLKVPQKDAFGITKFGIWLEVVYSENLTFHRGKVHEYLKMDVDYSKKGISM